MTVAKHVGLSTHRRDGTIVAFYLTIPGPAMNSPFHVETRVPPDEAAFLADCLANAVRSMPEPPAQWMDWQAATVRLARCLIELRELAEVDLSDTLSWRDVDRVLSAWGGTDLLRKIEVRYEQLLDEVTPS